MDSLVFIVFILYDIVAVVVVVIVTVVVEVFVVAKSYDLIPSFTVKERRSQIEKIC